MKDKDKKWLRGCIENDVTQAMKKLRNEINGVKKYLGYIDPGVLLVDFAPPDISILEKIDAICDYLGGEIKKIPQKFIPKKIKFVPRKKKK